MSLVENPVDVARAEAFLGTRFDVQRGDVVIHQLAMLFTIARDEGVHGWELGPNRVSASPFAGRLSDADLVVACRNIGYDLTCGACACVFYTGTGMVTDEHTCTGSGGQPKRIITPGGEVCRIPSPVKGSQARKDLRDAKGDALDAPLGGEVGMTAPSTSMKLFRRRFVSSHVQALYDASQALVTCEAACAKALADIHAIAAEIGEGKTVFADPNPQGYTMRYDVMRTRDTMNDSVKLTFACGVGRPGEGKVSADGERCHAAEERWRVTALAYGEAKTATDLAVENLKRHALDRAKVTETS